MIVPAELVDLDALVVVADRLDYGCCAQLGAVETQAKQKHTQIGEQIAAGEGVVIKQFLIALLLHRGLDPI